MSSKLVEAAGNVLIKRSVGGFEDARAALTAALEAALEDEATRRNIGLAIVEADVQSITGIGGVALRALIQQVKS